MVVNNTPQLRLLDPLDWVTTHVACGEIHRVDSGTGVEVNLAGYASIKIAWVEGVEVGLLGLVAGLDLRHPGIKLPGYGRIGIDPPVATALAK